MYDFFRHEFSHLIVLWVSSSGIARVFLNVAFVAISIALFFVLYLAGKRGLQSPVLGLSFLAIGISVAGYSIVNDEFFYRRVGAVLSANFSMVDVMTVAISGMTIVAGLICLEEPSLVSRAKSRLMGVSGPGNALRKVFQRNPSQSDQIVKEYSIKYGKLRGMVLDDRTAQRLIDYEFQKGSSNVLEAIDKAIAKLKWDRERK